MNRRKAIQKTALMLGYAVSAPAILGMLKGCKATPELSYTPVFFSPAQAHLVSEVAESIVPRTDTPGAIDAGVPAFIDQMLHEVYSGEEQGKFLAGLSKLNESAREKMGDDFVSLSTADKSRFIEAVNAEALEGRGGESEGWWAAGSSQEKPFFLTIKELTILGFFTSEPGATQVLQYNEVPGPYRGCVPLNEIGKAWAT